MAAIPEKLTISWLREAYLSGSVTPREVLRAVVDRAQRYASKNIYIVAPESDRLEAALKKLERLDKKACPLWGIPFTVKDNIDVEGYPTTAGCPDYAYRPAKSAGAAGRLTEAGAVPVGKANLDQFATGLVGTRSPYGPVHNALRDDLISGGSSSGSAVSVALGISAFSLGTDTAGSGRVPAALNGLYGFKPSCGAWPTDGVVPACASLDCVTVFANTMEDAQAVDAVARGFSENDPWSKNVPLPVLKEPAAVFIPAEEPEFFGPFARQYRGAWKSALALLAEKGVAVKKTDTAFLEKAAAILYAGPWVAERWADLGGFVEAHPGKVFPVTEKILRSGAHRDAAELFKAIHTLQAMKARARRLLSGAVLVMPTTGGTWARQDVEADPVGTNSLLGAYTNHCNLLDLCACSIPAGAADENLPFGITAFALSGAEGLIAAFARKLSQ